MRRTVSVSKNEKRMKKDDNEISTESSYSVGGVEGRFHVTGEDMRRTVSVSKNEKRMIKDDNEISTESSYSVGGVEESIEGNVKSKERGR